MANKGYKKYMKKNVRAGHPFLKIFILSFFGTLLLASLLINSYLKNLSVDTSIGDYKESSEEIEEPKKILDDRLQMIQNEDRGETFEDKMSKAVDIQNTKDEQQSDSVFEIKSTDVNPNKLLKEDTIKPATQDTVYKVFVGSYTSAEQARVAKEIIQESGGGLNPIVKCIGANEYTLQVGIFKNKQSAESMLYTIQQSHLPGRIVQEN